MGRECLQTCCRKSDHRGRRAGCSNSFPSHPHTLSSGPLWPDGGHLHVNESSGVPLCGWICPKQRDHENQRRNKSKDDPAGKPQQQLPAVELDIYRRIIVGGGSQFRPPFGRFCPLNRVCR